MFRRYEPFVEAGIRYPVAAPMTEDGLENVHTGAAMDRGTRLLEAVVCDALEHATGTHNLTDLGVPLTRVGFVVGTSSAGLGAFTDAVRGMGHSTEARYFFGAQHVACALGVEGPVQVVCSVCASGAQAIAEACDWLRWGVVDVVVAAGYDVLEPFVGAGFSALGAATDCPMPFRAQRRGLVLGEGGAALVLAPAGCHRFRSFGSILGWASTSDAHHLTAPHPEGLGVARALCAALAAAGLKSAEVRAVNAHGTATVHNDRMEARALHQVFGARAGGIPVYTVKGTIGHTLGAAGALEAVVSLLSMANGIIPPTATQGDEDPECDLDLVVQPRSLFSGPTLSISAGFGGVNCVLVLQGAER